MHTAVSRPRARSAMPHHGAPRGRHAAAHGTRRQRLLPMAVLGAIAASLLIFQYQFRHLEAATAADMYNVITPTLAAPRAPIVWFGLGTTGAFGLVITPDCSSALLIAPLCVLGMGLMIPRKLDLRRVWAALAVAAGLLVVGNMARIGLIAEMIHLYGIGTGYQLGHLILGSVLSIVCIAISMVALTLIITGNRRRVLRSLLHGRREVAA